MKNMRSLLAVAMAGGIVLVPVARAAPAATSACPLEQALDFHVVQALKVNGVTDAQFEALAAAGEIRSTLDDVCVDEIQRAAASPDAACQAQNRTAFSRLSGYAATAAVLFAVTGDAPGFRSNIRAILRTYLEMVPQRCWFHQVGAEAVVNQQPKWTAQQCTMFRANFEACKRQAESALKQCTVTPWIRDCASTAPTCPLPPC